MNELEHDGVMPALRRQVEAMSDGTRNWLVLRTDDAGNTFLVEDALDAPSARALVVTMTARGHKQTYSAISYHGLAARTDLLALLKVRI